MKNNYFNLGGICYIDIYSKSITYVTNIDIDDFDKVNKYTWFLNSNGYAVANARIGLKKKQIYLHRLIMGDSKLEVDHIDRNPLNNKKDNLRFVTRSQNAFNRGLQSNNKSGYSGINLRNNRWRVRIKVDNKEKFLGNFVSLKEAIKARNLAELKYFKEYAKTR